MAETAAVCCRYHVPLSEERLGGSWVVSEAVRGVDGGDGYCATRKHHHHFQGGHRAALVGQGDVVVSVYFSWLPW